MVDESEDAAIEEGANAEATEKAETTEIDETIEADESADGPCQKCPDARPPSASASRRPTAPGPMPERA